MVKYERGIFMKSYIGQKDLLVLGANVLITFAIVAGFTLASSQGTMGPEGPSGPAGSQGIPGSNGQDGSDGLPGEPGEDGQTPYIGENGNWWIGDTDTGVSTNSNGGEGLPEIDYSDLSLPIRFERAITEYENYRIDNPLSFNQVTYVSDLINNQGYTSISNVEEFFGLIGANSTGKFVLENDINFASIPSWAELPVFSGTLDGANYALLNLSSSNFDSANNNTSLFNELFGATVKNMVLHSFTFDDIGSTGVLATYINDSFIDNVSVVSSSIFNVAEFGLLSSSIDDSTLYDISISDSSLTSIGVSGLLSAFVDSSIIMGTTLANSTIETINGYTGGIAGYVRNSIIHNVDARDLTITINQGTEGATQEVRNLGFVVGYSADSFIEGARVVDSEFSMLSLADTANSVILNFGGIVGYGENILLMNSQYGELNGLEVMFTWDDYYTDTNYDVYIEYIGGIAGYLSDYTLISAENHVIVSVQDSIRDDLNNNSIAGIVGYSSRQGFIYEATNYAQILGNEGVAGIVGGVGFNAQFGNIQMDKVANYGSIYGWFGVSGIVGNLDGQTSLSIRNAHQSGLVMGFGSVGGLVGSLVVSFALPVTIENSVVQGQVFGIYDLGGVIGSYNNFSEIFSLVTLNYILMLAEVTNMALGLVILGVLMLDFDSYFDEIPFFAQPYTGLIIGARYAAVHFNVVVAYQVEIEQPLFEADFDNMSFTYSDATLVGAYEPVGYGQGAAVVLFNGGPNLADDAFLEDFFGTYTPWMAVASGDTSMINLDGIYFETPDTLEFNARPFFFLPYFDIFIEGLFLP